jgi:hypothetical protein
MRLSTIRHIHIYHTFYWLLAFQSFAEDEVETAGSERAPQLAKKFPQTFYFVVRSRDLTVPSSVVTMASSSTGGSNLPRPSKSRLPVSVSSTSSRLAIPSHLSTAAVNLSPRLASPSTPRILKSPVVRPQNLTINAKPSRSYSSQIPPPERPRTKSVPKHPPRFRAKEAEQATPSKVPSMSMKEAIALKRAETKKAIAAQRAFSDQGRSSICDGVGDISLSTVDGDDLGRLSLRETIERARCSGVHQSIQWITYHSVDHSGYSKARSTSRHVISCVFPLRYLRFISQ